MGIDSSNILPCQIFLMDGNYMQLPSNIVALAIRSLPKNEPVGKTPKVPDCKNSDDYFPTWVFPKIWVPENGW